MIEFVISMVGILFVSRILCSLENLKLISRNKSFKMFFIFQFPIYLFLYFKELFVFLIIYIGIFFVTLMLFDKIIQYFAKKTFFQRQTDIVERIILHLRSGKSASESIKNVFFQLSDWEQQIFWPLNEFFQKEKTENQVLKIKIFENTGFFEQIYLISKSSHHLTEQFQSFREALKTQKNLRHRSRQCLQVVRAQAISSIAIYVILLLISMKYLNFEIFSAEFVISLSLFLSGQVLIFKLGGTIKWKT